MPILATAAIAVIIIVLAAPPVSTIIEVEDHLTVEMEAEATTTEGVAEGGVAAIVETVAMAEKTGTICTLLGTGRTLTILEIETENGPGIPTNEAKDMTPIGRDAATTIETTIPTEIHEAEGGEGGTTEEALDEAEDSTAREEMEAVDGTIMIALVIVGVIVPLPP